MKQKLKLKKKVLDLEDIEVGEKIIVNKKLLKEELDNHYEVLTEAIQTVLRKNKVPKAYEILKELSRGKELTKKDLQSFIKKLSINENDKKRLLELTPSNYIGLSEEIVNKN